MNLQATNSLKGALAGLYYKEGCDQNGWAYISLEDIHNNKDAGILVFRKGAHKISVKIMQSIVHEIKEISRPAGSSGFLFDYLAFKVGQKDHYGSSNSIVANPVALCWVKAGGGGGGFSSGQVEALGKVKLQVAVFRIRDVLAPPRQVEIRLDIKSGEEWLDELDERREEAESDDEYF
jgi:hypothetical protein